ncbi:phytanoyl-CoA dioxygenase family protein [Paraglaciecola arctica]|uniref:Phytanoyl-CoA dioxygenase n=1 Tax=Paraglaciecola arctica BSs20135 TaxID=493475 RepID=K6YTC6_9ALTE|nr:phytanoyl-CoA dioxygenase family protein [Paraglaciecola arctica]GAC19953.1 hypothetical protein GARC_2990 [Paraglaciecola arctica BSs20135]
MNISEHVTSETLVETPIAAIELARKALTSGMTGSLFAAAQNTYQDIAAFMVSQYTDTVAAPLPQEYKYLPHASSVSLGAIDDKALVDVLLAEIGRGTAGCFVRKMLGSNEVLCDLDQAWIRRQYALHLYPLKHAAHGWHQDGALGFDFLKAASALKEPEALLPTVTCWIALTECGVDAPGLEFVSQDIRSLLLPEELTDNNIFNRFSADSFFKPQMEAGDAVIFSGASLHRTHVLKEMQSNRTSVELRFVAKDNIPQRLLGDCFVALPRAVD